VYERNKVYPNKQSAMEGDSVRFFCKSYGSTTWSFSSDYRSNTLPNITRTYRKINDFYVDTIVLKKLSVKNEGYLICKGLNRHRVKFQGHGKIKVYSSKLVTC